MSQTQAVYGGLPVGAGAAASASYPASVSAAGGYGIPMGSLPYYNSVNTSVLPPNYGYVMNPALRPARAAGGALVDAGIGVAGAAANIGLMNRAATEVLGAAVGPVGGVVTAGVGMVSGSRTRKNGIADMIEGYREVVANQLGVSPETVDEKALREAAKKNEVLAQALEAYDDGARLKPVITGVGAVTGLAAGAAATAALALTGPLGIVAGIGGGILTSMATDKVLNGVMGTQDLQTTVHAKVAELKGKLEAGEYLSPKDVFSVHVRMNGKMAVQIKELCGKEFHELDAEGQAKAMFYYKELTEMATQEAYLVNSGAIKPEMIPFIPLNTIAATMQPVMMPQAITPMTPPIVQDVPTTRIAANDASVEPMQARAQGMGGFAAKVNAERAAAANQPYFIQQ